MRCKLACVGILYIHCQSLDVSLFVWLFYIYTVSHEMLACMCGYFIYTLSVMRCKLVCAVILYIHCQS